MGKHADIERMLRMFRDGEYKIHQLRKEHKYAIEARNEVTGLKTLHFGSNIRVQGGDRKDPVYETYENEIQAYDQKAQSAMQTIRCIENLVDQINAALLDLPKEEEAVIRWKYQERLPEKYILHKLKKEINFPVCRAQLYKMMDDACESLKQIIDNHRQI